MINLLIHTYFPILLAVFGMAGIIIFTGCYFILKPQLPKSISPEPVSSKNKELVKPKLTITSNDISAIAGDDVVATQLDLARAYIESGRNQLAKNILTYVIEQGSLNQQSEAQRLLAHL